MSKLELSVRVLCMREDEAWCAIALDMSIRGYGDTQEEAIEALNDALLSQVSFAVQHDNLDEIFVPAEPHYFGLYADVKRESMKRFLQNKTVGLTDIAAGDFNLPDLFNLGRDQFEAIAV